MQESYLRAIRFFSGYRGGTARSWLLAIVRSTSLTWLDQKRRRRTVAMPEPGEPDEDGAKEFIDETVDLEADLIQKQAGMTMDQIIQALPTIYREIIILRETEELSYAEIAEVIACRSAPSCRAWHVPARPSRNICPRPARQDGPPDELRRYRTIPARLCR